jgi:RNA polymerase sigma factor (sigma-70 family)
MIYTLTAMQIENNLWELFRAGSELAFSQIIDSHYNLLFNYGRKFKNDPDFIKDCLQDLFVELWQNKENLSNTPSVKHYLLKSFRRKVIRETQKATKYIDKNKDVASDDIEKYAFEVAFSPEYQLIFEETSQEQQQKLQEKLQTLSSRQKEVIYLRFYNDLSFDEIASVMSVNVQSVRNLLHQTILILRKYFAEILLLFSSFENF